MGEFAVVREFFTGPVIKADLMVAWLEKHGIGATLEYVDLGAADDGDLSRESRVSVAEADFERAWRLFYAEREDEL